MKDTNPIRIDPSYSMRNAAADKDYFDYIDWLDFV